MSGTAGGGATRSPRGTTSVRTSPPIFASSRSIARSAPVRSERTLGRSPRGRYPSSSADPTGSPAARRVARLAITGSTVAHARDVRPGRDDVRGAFGGEHARAVGRHAGDDRDAAPSGLARERTARVAVPSRAERGAAHQDVGPDLVEPREQPGERLLLVLAESIVAARERDVDLEPRCHQPSAGAGRALDPDRLVTGGLLATQAGEELVEVVDDGHAGTAVNDMSPVSHARAQVRPRSGPARRIATGAGRSDHAVGRPRLDELVLVADADDAVGLGDVIGEPAVRLADDRRGTDPERLARPHGQHGVGVRVAGRERGADRPVGAEPASEPSGQHRGALLLERAVQVAEREDEPGEPQPLAVCREERPDERRVLVGRGDVADGRPVVRAVRQRAVQQLERIEHAWDRSPRRRARRGTCRSADPPTRPAGCRTPPAGRDRHPGRVPRTSPRRRAPGRSSWPRCRARSAATRAAPRDPRRRPARPRRGTHRTTTFVVDPQRVSRGARPVHVHERVRELVPGRVAGGEPVAHREHAHTLDPVRPAAPARAPTRRALPGTSAPDPRP